jgi:hypothetical protein
MKRDLGDIHNDNDDATLDIMLVLKLSFQFILRFYVGRHRVIFFYDILVVRFVNLTRSTAL